MTSEEKYGLWQFVRSHPTRVRGLKSEEKYRLWQFVRSHPTRVRGLKYIELHVEKVFRTVAPYTGAWIEIFLK
ncbi:hypothetical protein ACTGWU_10695, partial [Streptococcus suis]